MCRLSVFFAVLCLSSGCGAKVVIVDEDGSGGATGGTSNGTAGTNGTNSSSGTDAATTGSTTTTGGFISPCQRLCMDFAHCFEGDCLNECQALYEAGCETETSEYVLCLAHNFGPNCELGMECDGELAVHQNCVAPTIDCVETRCSQVSNGCACDGFCDATNLVQTCQKNDDFFECDCTVDGQFIGTCVESDNICELDMGCCKEVWLLTWG